MKNEWSNKWVSSTQPRKQRKYRENAPLHIRRKFLSVNLSASLRERYGKRSMVVRKGDDVRVLRGGMKGKTGTVEKASISREKIYIEGIKVKKVDGSEVSKPFQPSNLQITKLNLDDKRRQAVIERSEKKPAARSAPPGSKESGAVKKTAVKKK
jgi:large subunit ribosomal protein L24